MTYVVNNTVAVLKNARDCDAEFQTSNLMILFRYQGAVTLYLPLISHTVSTIMIFWHLSKKSLFCKNTSRTVHFGSHWDDSSIQIAWRTQCMALLAPTLSSQCSLEFGWHSFLCGNLSRRTLNVHDVTFTTLRYLFYSPKKKPLLGLFTLVSNKKL